jgi:hypothetical protein
MHVSFSYPPVMSAYSIQRLAFPVTSSGNVLLCDRVHCLYLCHLKYQLISSCPQGTFCKTNHRKADMGFLQQIREESSRTITTVLVMPVMFSFGLYLAMPGPTILDLQQQTQTTLTQISLILTARSAGGGIGSLISEHLLTSLSTSGINKFPSKQWDSFIQRSTSYYRSPSHSWCALCSRT